MGKRRIVSMADYGVIPDTTEDFALAFNEFADADVAKCATVYRFVKGTYRAYASHGRKKAVRNNGGVKANAILKICGKRNLTIDGDGSKLILYGSCTPFHLVDCENVTLKNFVIDWEQPMAAEGKVVGRCADYIDIEIDTSLFPCYVKDYCLYFSIGDGENYPLTYGLHTVFDPSSLTVAPNSADHIMVSSAERITENVFRIYLSGLLAPNMPPRVGDLISLRHNQSTHPAIFVENCVGLELENVTVHSCGAESVKIVNSDSVSISGLNCVPNQKAGRRVSAGRNGGIVMNECSGNIVIDGCIFHALQETPISLVSSCKTLLDINEKSVNVLSPFEKDLTDTPYIRCGDRVNVIERTTLKTVFSFIASADSKQIDGGWQIFSESRIPKAVRSVCPEDYVVENASRAASLTVRNCHLGSCRSRGIIVTTSGKVLIENNIFESAGAAILMGGDAIYWYGLGSSNDVTIKGNIFTDVCTTARYHNSPAMITINPEIPKPIKGEWYHKNITITENTFHTPDTPILYAYCADGLFFENNRIIKSHREGIQRDINQLVFVKNSNNVRVCANAVTGRFGIERVKFENCTAVDTKGKKDERS